MSQDVNSLMTDFAAIPDKLAVDAGKYLCTVVGVDPKKSANAPGTVMFAPQFEITHDIDQKTGNITPSQSAGAMVFDSFLPFCIDPTGKMSNHQKKMALAKTKRLLMAVNFTPDMAAMAASGPTPDQIVETLKASFVPQMLQKQVVVSVGVDKDGRNRVNDYDVFTGPGGAAGGAPATAPATAPPTA